MKRRDFITLISVAAAAWPLAVRAQKRMARIGALMDVADTNASAKAWVDAFESGLAAAGWNKDRNVEITYRWGASNAERLMRYAEELVQSGPDVLMVHGTSALVPLHKLTTTIPIVFTAVSDPVAQGFVASVSHPGGNLTGFSNFEPNIGDKWLQLLKEIAPSAKHVGVMFNPRTAPYGALLMRSIEAAAPSLGLVPAQATVQNEDEIRTAIGTLAAKGESALVVLPDTFTLDHAALIASLANGSRLPTIYSLPQYAHAGGLVAYGIDLTEQLRKAADYVDRILRGEKAGDLPIQAPTRYTMTINLKTAKALGIAIPDRLLATADDVIE
jgi:ABC-type uncharacterized transport system substrate-binding protein